MPEPQMPEKEVAITYFGKKINPDEYTRVTQLPRANQVTIVSKFSQYAPPQDLDFNDISQIQRELATLVPRLYAIKEELDKAGRNSEAARFAYESEKRRRLVALAGGSERTREAMAEIMTEELYSRSIVAAQVTKELRDLANSTRTHLEALGHAGNNARSIIKMQ